LDDGLEAARAKITGSNILRLLINQGPSETHGALTAGEIARELTGLPANRTVGLVTTRLKKLVILELLGREPIGPNARFRIRDVDRATAAIADPQTYGLSALDIVSPKRAAHRPTIGEDPVPRLLERVRQHAERAAPRLLTRDLDLRAIEVSLAVGTDEVGRPVQWVRNERGSRLGTWYRDTGMLTLLAEQLRGAVVQALLSHGIQVTPADGTKAGYTNAILRPLNEDRWRIDLVASLNPIDPALWTIGHYDATDGSLAARHASFGPGMAALVRRHGLPVTSIVEDHDTFVLYGYKGRTPIGIESTLREEIEALRLIRGLRDRTNRNDELLATTMLIRRRLCPESATLIPADSAMVINNSLPLSRHYESDTDCIICGNNVWYPVSETTGVAVHEHDREHIAFAGDDVCHACAQNARDGLLSDEGVDHDWEPVALWAIRELSEEFGGPPSKAQLRTPVRGSKTERTRSLLLRMLVPSPGWPVAGIGRLDGRKPRSWSEWLSEAGVLAGGWRPSRGLISTATDGHLCHSMLERHIDDFLAVHGIEHEREPMYPYDEEVNVNGMRADWQLADGTLVEALGFPNDPSYQAKVAAKRLLAGAYSLRLIEITPEDLGLLPVLFSDWLPA